MLATTGAAGTGSSSLQRYWTLTLRSADLVEDGFDDFTVGAGQNLAKNSAGNLDVEGLALGTIEAGRLKPGIERC